MFGFLSKLMPVLFGSSSNGKGIVTEVSDVVDKWHPSAETLQKNSLDDTKAGDASQADARQLHYTSHDSWFDIFIDGLNRLPRPLFAYWAFGVLVGWFPKPDWTSIDPMTQNIIWTVITFYFGARFVWKDIPAMWTAIKNSRSR